MKSGSDVAVPLDACAVRVIDAAKVEAARDALADDATVTNTADVFGLLADPTRLRLLLCLLEGGEMCVCDLAAATGQSESNVSHALRLLRAHRVVLVRRAGRMAHYRLADGHVRMLLDVTLTHTGHATPLHNNTNLT